MKQHPRVYFILAVVGLGLAGGGYYLFSDHSGGQKYREVSVRRGDIGVSILATGTVQPQNRVDIKAPINGRVEQVLSMEGAKVKRGQILAWMSSTERAAMLDAARAKGGKEVKRWERLYRPTPILAPVNGTIIQRNVESGQTFTTTDAILVMSDRLIVKAQVDETDIAQIHLKEKASITLDAYSSEKISAAVDEIAYDAKTVNNVTTYVVDVLPTTTPDFMRSGMTANVTFLVSEKKGVLNIPAEAVKTQDGKSSVLVKVEGSRRPEEKSIKVGLSDGKAVEIVEGVSEGEIVLVPEFRPGKSNRSGGSPFSPAGRPRGR